MANTDTILSCPLCTSIMTMLYKVTPYRSNIQFICPSCGILVNSDISIIGADISLTIENNKLAALKEYERIITLIGNLRKHAFNTACPLCRIRGGYGQFHVQSLSNSQFAIAQLVACCYRCHTQSQIWHINNFQLENEVMQFLIDTHEINLIIDAKQHNIAEQKDTGKLTQEISAERDIEGI